MRRVLIAALACFATACSRADESVMQGYGEADYIYLAAQDGGVVSEILVREGDAVDAGAAVFRLDPDRLALVAQSANAQRAALVQAVEVARASVVLADRNFTRSQDLFQQGFFARARLDADRAARDGAHADLARARRSLSAAGADTSLARARVDDLAGAAPAAGTIERIYRRAGEVVAAGQPIAALLTPQNQKVRFFAPQPMLAQLPVGARVAIGCDGCAENLTATVSFVAREPQFTPPVIFSLERREKLVFLVEARLEIAGAIRPGMPVDVRVAAP